LTRFGENRGDDLNPIAEVWLRSSFSDEKRSPFLVLTWTISGMPYPQAVRKKAMLIVTDGKYTIYVLLTALL
jgi:hypothetical protein